MTTGQQVCTFYLGDQCFGLDVLVDGTLAVYRELAPGRL